MAELKKLTESRQKMFDYINLLHSNEQITLSQYNHLMQLILEYADGLIDEVSDHTYEAVKNTLTPKK